MTVNQGVPSAQSQLVDPRTFYPTPTWFQFFLSLWQRSGNGVGTSAVMPGTLSAFAGSTAPSGYLICNGAAVSRTTYANLFSAIGTTWGIGDGTTTFNVPDLRDRFPMGASGTHAVGSNGGASSVTLSVAQLPSHSHSVTDPGHVHASVVSASANTAGAAAGSVAAGNTSSATTGISLGNTGGGASVDLLNPFAAVNWIIAI